MDDGEKREMEERSSCPFSAVPEVDFRYSVTRRRVRGYMAATSLG